MMESRTVKHLVPCNAEKSRCYQQTERFTRGGDKRRRASPKRARGYTQSKEGTMHGLPAHELAVQQILQEYDMFEGVVPPIGTAESVFFVKLARKKALLIEKARTARLKR